MTLLTLKGLCAQPGRHCIGPFDLDVRPGERIAILGPSGAGKSTLLKLMARELVPMAGQAWLDGRPLADWPAAALSARRAVLPQAHQVAFSFDARLVVGLGRTARLSDPQRERIVDACAALARASHLLGRSVGRLSGGELARIQLARVFAQLWDVEQGLLLVDEPLAALDPGLQLELLATIQAYARERGHAVVAVLHDISQALGQFERLWLVHAGRLVGDIASGTQALGALEQLYGLRLQAVHVPGGFGVVASLAQASA